MTASKNRQAQNQSLTVFIFWYGDHEEGCAFLMKVMLLS